MNLTGQNPDRGKRRAFVSLTIGLAVLVSLMAAEIFVRLAFRLNTPDTVHRNSLQYAPTIFSRHMLRPNQLVNVDEAWGLGRNTEPTHRIYRINEFGYRGHTFSTPKTPDSQRIVIVGGSAVFDLYATEGKDWPHQVEQLLKARGFPHAEVLNAGVPGHASFDSLGRLYSQIWMLNPDFVLLYNAWNDIKYFTALSPSKPLIYQIAPFDPEADPLQNYLGVMDRVMCHSQLYVKLRTRYFLWKLNVGEEGAIPLREYQSAYDPFGLDQYRLDLRLFVDASREIGSTPILLTQASLIAPDNTAVARARITYSYQGLSHEALMRAMSECNDAVREIGREKGADVLDLAAMFNGRADLFNDHVHTTERGSEAIASAVARFLAGRMKRQTH